MRRQSIAVLGSLVAITVMSLGGLAFADFKNLQVLPKTTSKEEIRAIMKAQAKALDVECDHCHKVPDMAADDLDTKKMARQMMKLTAEINDKWLKGMKGADKNKVTCGTCHRGHAEPPPFGT